MKSKVLSSIALCALQFLIATNFAFADESLPPVQILVPGFEVRELPAKLTNLVNIEYAPDGKLFAAGYDGRIHLVSDSDGDGLEDKVHTIWDKTSDDYPLGMVVHDKAVYVLRKAELERFVDSDSDGIPDKREVVLSDWDDAKLQKHPLILRRRVDYAMGLAIGPDGCIYIGMGNAAYNNAYMLDKDGKLGDKDVSHYDPKNIRGCVLRFSPDGKSKEQLLTGTRYLMSLQFNAIGDLFGTDQEGATWMPNGNPFDELLHLEPGRHYGFPPSHPKYLPNVVDEPSVFDYAPQHQSICGFRFNDRSKSFGPAWWKGDAILAGYTRGKLYRTKTIKTDAGYVAHNQLFGQMQSLASDVAISPQGELVVASHTGKPDWGTGPSGNGILHKIRYHAEPPVPVWAWSAGPGEFRISFDKPLSPALWKNLAKQVSIEAGTYVFAADRLEKIRPGYEVVKLQQLAQRRIVDVLSSSLSPDSRTIILYTPRSVVDEHYAITLPALERHSPTKEELNQEARIDLLADLHGVVALHQADSDSGAAPTATVLSHAEMSVAKALVESSAEQQQWIDRMRGPGVVTLRGKLDLWEMLHPAIQPNAKLDYERAVEEVTVVVTATVPFQMDLQPQKLSSKPSGDLHKIEFQHTGKDKTWVPFELRMKTSDKDPQLKWRWFTATDQRLRAFATRRFVLPWAVPASEESIAEVDRSKMPELAGGNWQQGRQIFFGDQVNCSKCHQVRGEGAKVGPDLSNLVQRDYDSVYRDISQPSAAMNPDYLAYTVLLTDGRVMTGVVHSETKERLHLADNTGKLTEVPRSDIEKIAASKTSVMPEELLKKLNDQQLRDLMTFLLIEPKK